MSGDSRAELLPAVAAEPEHVSVAVNAQPKTVASIGNQAAQAAVRSRATAGNPPFDNHTRSTLRIGAPDDAFERDAERIAHRIVSGSISRYGDEAPVDHFQRPAAPSSPVASSAVYDRSILSLGAGDPLEPDLRGDMESRLDGDFSAVRIHRDDQAAKSSRTIGARAFTHGTDVYFAAGQFAPATAKGAHLLSHELAHTQQTTAPDELHRQVDAGIPDLISAPVLHDAGITVSPMGGMSGEQYIEKYSSNIAVTLNVLMSRVELNTGSPYASWRAGTARTFGEAIWNLPERDLLPTLRWLLQPLDPAILIDRGRNVIVEVGPQGKNLETGSDKWSEDAATEIRNALTSQLSRSLQRIMPRYVMLRYQSKLAQPKNADVASLPEPYPDDLLPAHPMDRLVGTGLNRGGMVVVDFDRLAKDKPVLDLRYAQGGTRMVTFEFQGSQGAWLWLRVTSPLDATTEEVANSLYGDTTQAWRLVDATPLFGFSRIDLLLPAHRDKLKEMAADPNAAQSALDPNAKATVAQGLNPSGADPLAELRKGQLADSAALNQAGKLKAPPEITKDMVLENMRLSFEVLDAMIPNAKRFQADGRLAEARDFIFAKRRVLQTLDDVEVMRWAAQSAEQKRVLAGASAGLAEAVVQFDHLLSAGSSQQANELADNLRLPLFELANAYVTAATLSFFVGSGAAELAAADERSRLFGIELMEGILRSVAHSIEVAEQNAPGRNAGSEIEVSALRAREEALRIRLALAREAILRNPDQIGDILEKIYADIADLQAETGIVSNLDAIDIAQKALFDSQSWFSDILLREYELRGGYLNEVDAWRALWTKVYDEWKKGDHAAARAHFRELVTQPGYKSLFERVASYIDDAHTWDLVARLVVLVAITALTMGVGAYATAFGATAWGGAAAATGELTVGAATAGLVAGTVAEAATFTVLNTLLLEPNPTWKGFLGEFAWNLALFGILRKASMLYRGAAAVKAASGAGRNILVASGEMSMQWAILTTATIARAEVEKQLEHKKNLTKEEIGLILLKSTAMFIGMAVAMRVAQPLMLEIAASGATMGVRVRLINAQRARLATLAEMTATGGNLDAARELLVLDRAELQAEMDFYKQLLLDPSALAKAGYTAEQIKTLRDTGEQQIAEIGAAESLIGADRIGANEYSMLQDDLVAALRAHERTGATTTLLRSDATAKSETWLIKPKTGPEIRLTTKPPGSINEQLAALRAGLSPEGQEAFDRFLGYALTPESALEQLREMLRGKRGLDESIIAAARKLPVQATVPGLYAGVKVDPRQGPWKFETIRTETDTSNGREVRLETKVTLTTPDGKTYSGDVTRTITLRRNAAGDYDVTVTMNSAGLDRIPKDFHWVNEGGVPLVQNRGTPLQTYVTLMQMRSEGVGLGQITQARMKTIVNIRTCLELAVLRRTHAPGVPPERLPSKLIERTQSGRYGGTNVVQAGGKVKRMRIDGGTESTVDYLVEGSEMDSDVELAKLGLSRKDKVLWGFDIVIDIEPPTPAPTLPGKSKP